MLKREQKRTIFIASSLVVVGGGALAVGLAAASASSQQARDAGVIASGVKIATVPVGGLTREAAREKARDWARKQDAQVVTLTAPVSGKKWNWTLASAGGRWDLDTAVDEAFQVGKEETLIARVMNNGRSRDVTIAPEFKLNEAQLTKCVAGIAPKVHTPARNARATMKNGSLTLSRPERKGIKLDVAQTVASLLKNGPQALKDGETAKIVVTEEKPAVTAADLGQVGTLIASFSTDYGSSSSNRRHNVETAANHINGTLLAPNGVFSYNDIVGPRDRSLGWRDAPTYQDGQVVPGPGGGVCQVSTTLYNAVLRGNLKVVQRSHHSMPVHYVPAGCDATVAYDSIDFKFQNSTPGPLYVHARARGGRLTFNLYGKAPERKFTADVFAGSRHGNRSGGFTVSSFRVIKFEDGETVREVLSTDTYRAPAAHGDSPRRVASSRRRRRRSSPVAVRASRPAAPSVTVAAAGPSA